VVPFYVAQEQNFFRDEKLAVDLVPVASAAERDQMMVTGQIDGQLNDLISTVLFNAEKTRITIVRKARCAFRDAPQIFILAAKNSKIQTPRDLKGVEIGISENSQIAYVIDRLLQREGFGKEEIRTVHVAQIPTRFQLLSQGQIQAAGLPDPLASLAMLQGARRILDDSQHPEVSLSVISFRKDVVEGREEDVRAFLRAYDRAIEAIRSHPDRFRNLLIEKARVPDPLKDRYPFPPFPDPSVPSPEQWGDVVQWAMEKGIVKGPVPYEGSVQQGFVK
jgi:NitT/TauT family transport system substrate-binding protein